jgi:murein DD-endopeptidase MepM/ murein hydrolase activator NlpD
MKLTPLLLAFSVAVLPGLAIAKDARIDIRFCPQSRAYAYPLESRREVQSLVLQAAAIVNRGAEPVVITSIDIDLLRSGQALDTRTITQQELLRRGELSPGIPDSDTKDSVPCRAWDSQPFAGDAASEGPRMEPGQALLVYRQLLAFQGARDTLRVTVHAKAGGRVVDTSAWLPVRTDMSRTAFRFPLRGVWWAGVGATPHTGHRWAIAEEFALDIGKLGGEGQDHGGVGDQFTDYYGYGATVLAAADGRVVTAVDGVAEHPEAMRRTSESMEAYAGRLRRQQAAIVSGGVAGLLGNYVVIDHGNGEYSHYAHLAPGSVSVKTGDAVREGQTVGMLGSSGNSTAPHLHFQVCDGPDPLDCAGIPITFKGLDMPWGDYPRPIQSGDMVVAD